MTWELASQIATTFGAIVGGITVFSAFILYRTRRRDDAAGALQETVAVAISRIQRLSDLLPQNALAHEVSEAICRSDDGQAVMLRFYSEVLKPVATEEKMEAFFDEMMLPFSAPVKGSTIDAYRSYLDGIEASCVPYRHSYPGLCLLLTSLVQQFRSTLRDTEEMLRDRDMWASIFRTLKENSEWTETFEEFSRMSSSFFTIFAAAKITEQDRYDLLRLAEMALTSCKAYLMRSPGELNKQSDRERRLFPVIPYGYQIDDVDDAALDTYLSELLGDEGKAMLFARLIDIAPPEIEDKGNDSTPIDDE